MEIDSVSKEDEQRRRFEKDVESVLSDKVLDIKKTFVKKKWETVKKKQSNSPPPTLNRRDIETQPCGLYNSGNFCYVNSFLQTWYNDLVFRQCIYDWRPLPGYICSESARMNIQDVMNSIQKLFVTMQLTPYEHTDAAELIDLLKLKNDQQDVQEFFILFFEVITRNLESHKNGHEIRSKILSRVEGTTKKTIKCTCGKSNVTEEKFRSIPLHIENGVNSLSKLLRNHWVEEPMLDYICDKCGKRGNTTILSECAQLPPVLVVQLNRYQYDPTTGNNKKIANPIQYPRELHENVIRANADPDSVYELGAVMIHEGSKVSCGHYFDIIKDAKTGNWFSFNDKEVTQAKTPGVYSEREKIGKPTPDMKGCYVLIYRKIENWSDDDEIRLPPPEIVEEIQRKLDISFEDKTIGEDLSYKVWMSSLDERFNLLQHYWSLMEVNSCKSILDNPDGVAFLPTQLLIDITNKEYDAVKQLKDSDLLNNDKLLNTENENDSMIEALKRIGEHDVNVESDSDYMERLADETYTVSEEKKAARARIQREATMKNGTLNPEILKLLYVSEPLDDVVMPLCQHENISIESLKNGKVKAVNKSAAEELLTNYGIHIRLKRFTEEDENDSLIPADFKTGSDLCKECFKMLRHESTFKYELESCNKMAKEVLKRSTAKGMNGYEYPPPDSFWASRAQLTSFKKLATNEMLYQKSLGSKTPPLLIFSTKFNGCQKDEQQLNSVYKEDNNEAPPNKRRRMSSLSPQEEPQLNGNVEMSPEHMEEDGVTHESSPEIEVSYQKPKEAEQVYFNGDLICDHDGLDNKVKKVWLHKHEWETLVLENFQKYKEFPTTVQDCVVCSDAYNITETKRMDCHAKLRQINQSIGPVLSKIERRLTNGEGWEKCTHMLCSKFVYKFRNALKVKVPTMPSICQNCLYCSLHNLPFQKFAGGVENTEKLKHYDEACCEISATPSFAENGTNTFQAASYGFYLTGPLPITTSEWESIITEFQNSCGDEFEMPKEVLIENGRYPEFCYECEEKFKQTLLQRQLDYPEGADIYVIKKDDEGDDISGIKLAKARTRRGIQKNLIKVRLSSTNTVRDLKIKLYERIRQAPNDQLIYCGDRLLDNKQTLAEALITGNNSDNPLILITQQYTEIREEPRVVERGFAETALST